MKRMRIAIARNLKTAQNTQAQLTTLNEIDMTALMAIRKKHQEAFTDKHGFKLGIMGAFVKAATSALLEFPDVNAYIDENETVYRDYVDIGIAVASPKGLVLPVIRNCEELSLPQAEKAVQDWGKAARDDKVGMADMAGGNFTISNGGVFGSLFGTPMIGSTTQSAILGMHGLKQRPMVVNGSIVPRPMVYVALTYDHRIVDGREGVQFLKHIKEVIEDPRRLLLDLP